MYFSLPTQRVVAADPTQVAATTTDEPQLAFRYDAARRYDVKIPFGAGDKQSLLWQLGYDPLARQPYRQLANPLCLEVGVVRHYANGSDDAEQDTLLRGRLRIQSLQNLVARVETQLGLS